MAETERGGKDAHSFLNEIDSNPALQDRLQQSQADFIDLARQHGYDFNQEELHEALRQRWEIAKPKDDPNTCTVTAP